MWCQAGREWQEISPSRLVLTHESLSLGKVSRLCERDCVFLWKRKIYPKRKHTNVIMAKCDDEKGVPAAAVLPPSA